MFFFLQLFYIKSGIYNFTALKRGETCLILTWTYGKHGFWSEGGTHRWCTVAVSSSTHSCSRPSSPCCAPSWGTLWLACWSCSVMSCSLGCSTQVCWRWTGRSCPWGRSRTAECRCLWSPLPPWSGSGCRWCRGLSRVAADCSGSGWVCKRSWALSTGTLEPWGQGKTGWGCCWRERNPGCLDPWVLCSRS